MIVYTNSLLATLNARKRIRSAGSAIHTPTDISLSMRDFSTTASIGQRVRSEYNIFAVAGVFSEDLTLRFHPATDQYLDKGRHDTTVYGGWKG